MMIIENNVVEVRVRLVDENIHQMMIEAVATIIKDHHQKIILNENDDQDQILRAMIIEFDHECNIEILMMICFKEIFISMIASIAFLLAIVFNISLFRKKQKKFFFYTLH